MTYKAAALAILVCLPFTPASHSAETAEQAVTQADASFWRAYNACDMEEMGELLTDDVEFYHDVTGLTVSRSGVVESLRKGPCGDRTSRLRRELVDGTLVFHPLAGGYALLSGQHRFYVNQPGKQEHVAGQAEFTTVYKLDGGHWRMHRILSYAHGAPR